MVPLQQIKWHARNHGIKVLYKKHWLCICSPDCVLTDSPGHEAVKLKPLSLS